MEKKVMRWVSAKSDAQFGLFFPLFVGVCGATVRP
jgi:hypothetical protein